MMRVSHQRAASRSAAARYRAADFALLLIGSHCGRCGCAAESVHFWLPDDHEASNGDDGCADHWQCAGSAALVYGVVDLDRQTRVRLRTLLPTYRWQSVDDDVPCYRNSCEHCGLAITGLEDEEYRLGLGSMLCHSDVPPPLLVVTVATALRVRALGWTAGDLADAVAERIQGERSMRLPTPQPGQPSP